MEVQGVTPERADAIEDASVVDGIVDPAGNLKLITFGGQEKNAGSVIRPLASWPVNSIYIGATSTSPATLFGGGTWERFAKGRVLVGVDEADGAFSAPLGVAGEKAVTLTAAQSGMPSHNHGQDPHSHGAINGGSGGQAVVGDYAATFRLGVPGDGGSSYGPSGSVYAIGINNATATNQAAAAQNASQSHNNLQPYINVYMWRRTA